ncbi:MAG: ABC transporter substrate-binding protein [Nitrospirota bacterium]|nr:MAG: ABC transporter substrate-binding protein [Nitrospirota bacterium]
MRLKVGHLSTLYHTSALMLARAESLCSSYENIEWQLFGTGPAIIEALGNKELDIGYVGLPPAIIGIANGVRIKCVAGGHIEGTVMASHKDADDHSRHSDPLDVLSQFNIIGVPGNGSIHDLILRDAIDSTGSPAKVVNFRWSDNLLEAFIKKEVDAVIGTPALAQSIIKFAGGKIVIPPELLWPYNPSYGILVREEIMVEQIEDIIEFLKCHKSASELLRTEMGPVSRDISSYIKIVDKDFVMEALKISPHYCIAITDEYIDCSMRLAARLKDLGYIERDVERAEIFDLSLVNKIHPEPDHYRI